MMSDVLGRGVAFRKDEGRIGTPHNVAGNLIEQNHHCEGSLRRGRESKQGSRRELHNLVNQGVIGSA